MLLTYQFSKGGGGTPTNGAFIGSDDYAALPEEKEKARASFSKRQEQHGNRRDLDKTSICSDVLRAKE